MQDNAQPKVKPDWIKVRSGSSSDSFAETMEIIRRYGVNTICEESLCPNIGECWRKKTATFLIMGYTCTRQCGFCNIKSGVPKPVDVNEPESISLAVRDLGLKYVVVTSVARDDISDGGASHFADITRRIRKMSPETRIELLLSDFCGKEESIRTVADAKPDVFGHNIEVVRRLHKNFKKPPSDYDLSIKFLKYAKDNYPDMLTKSGIMVGIGESVTELVETFENLREAGVDILTVGQYISPSASHYPIDRYITPDEFEDYRKIGLDMGFMEVVSGPLVRSSYKAGETYSSLCTFCK